MESSYPLWNLMNNETQFCDDRKQISLHHFSRNLTSSRMTKPTKWPVCPAKSQISLSIRPVWSVFAVRMKQHLVPSYP